MTNLEKIAKKLKWYDSELSICDADIELIDDKTINRLLYDFPFIKMEYPVTIKGKRCILELFQIKNIKGISHYCLGIFPIQQWKEYFDNCSDYDE